MASAGGRTPPTIESSENRTEADANAGGSLPVVGQDMGATADAGGRNKIKGAQEAQKGALKQQGEAHRAALMEQAEAAAAKLKGLMAELAGTWVSPLAVTEPRVVALAARLVPAAECLETVRENLASTAAQPNSARERVLQAEAHLSFARLHMVAAQRLQTPTEEAVAPASAPPIPAGAQLVRALTEARGFEAAANALQASWTREALRRTACVSYVAIEACEVAVRAGWNPQECSTYHDLLHRKEQRLDEAFGGMMPDELPGAVVAVAEVWLDDAYDNITLAQTCLAARKQQEEKRAAALGKHPEPPDGEVSAEKARSLWIQRALRQTSYVSHMAKEMDDYSVETEWGLWSYERYRRMLDAEMAEVCRIYAEIELTDLPGSKGKEAQEWLTDAHGNVKREHERIDMHIRRLGGAGEPGAPLQNPKRVFSLKKQEKRRTQLLAYRKFKQEQNEEATARATGTPKGSQLAGEVDTGSGETGNSQRRDSTGPRHSPWV